MKFPVGVKVTVQHIWLDFSSKIIEVVSNPPHVVISNANREMFEWCQVSGIEYEHHTHSYTDIIVFESEVDLGAFVLRWQK